MLAGQVRGELLIAMSVSAHDAPVLFALEDDVPAFVEAQQLGQGKAKARCDLGGDGQGG